MRCRDWLIELKLLRHNIRQSYHLGWLKPEKTLKELIEFLESEGFHNHFFAWHDPGQILSLRKQTGFEWQYHLRIFFDGEIRGHFEHTPEADPIEHMLDEGMKPRHQQFLKFLGNYIQPVPPSSALKLRPIKVKD